MKTSIYSKRRTTTTVSWALNKQSFSVEKTITPMIEWKIGGVMNVCTYIFHSTRSLSFFAYDPDQKYIYDIFQLLEKT